MSDDGGDAEVAGPTPPKVVEYDPITGEDGLPGTWVRGPL